MCLRRRWYVLCFAQRQLAQTEHAHRLQQLTHLVLKRLYRAGGVRQQRLLLRDLIDLVHRRAYLFDHLLLARRGARHFLHDVIHRARAADNIRDTLIK